VLAIIMALVVAGCGGGTSPPPANTHVTPVKVSESSGAVTKKATRKGRGQALTPGGDLGVRERRSQKLKERAAAARS
jgi:hypothetical protein